MSDEPPPAAALLAPLLSLELIAPLLSLLLIALLSDADEVDDELLSDELDELEHAVIASAAKMATSEVVKNRINTLL